jgi:tetratricopeptide (TPR) repeat protein
MQSAARQDQNHEIASGDSDEVRLQIAISKALEHLQAGDRSKMSAVLQEAAAYASTSAKGSYVFGLLFFNIGELDKACEWFDASLALEQDFRLALAARGTVLHQLGRSHEALAAFEDLLRHDPQDAQNLHMSGVVLQGLGRLEDALAAYDRALCVAPEQCESLINRGVILDGTGRLDEALAAFDLVIKLRPEDATNLFNRGSVLHRLGRSEEALAAYETAKRFDNLNPELEVNLGNVLQNLGRHAEALSCYDAALELKPQYAQAHYNSGIALQRLQRRDEALLAYDAAIAAKPAYPEAYCNRGNVLSELGRRNEALASFATALKLKPGFVPALINRANILFEQGKPEKALAACAEILETTPDHTQALCIRGAALLRLELLGEALATLDRALAIRPTYIEAWLNRGNVLQEQGRLDDALASYDRALELNPDYAEAISSRGVALKELGCLDEALAAFDRALQLKPNFPDARNNRAGVLLLKGDLKRGFEDFENRWDRANAPPKTLQSTLPVWNGEPLAGRRLLVWDEQGLGDLIQFCRYLPDLIAAGAEVTFFSRKNMFRLLSTLPSTPHFVDRIDEPHTNYDYQVALVSLPHAFGTDRATVPAQVPYLHPEPALVEAWAERLGSAGYKIGICWHGRPKINLERNMPLSTFAPLAAIAGVRLISLMKDAAGESAEAAKAIGLEYFDEDLDKGPDSFVETAALMANLDLVITSDTSIAHLAGALGRPVFTALKWVPDWRWMAEGDVSPWYPTMRLFRQPSRGQWQPVFAKMVAAVEARIATQQISNRVEIALPSAVGELIDKITILEIKADKIQEPSKLENVRYELSLLRRLKAERNFAGPAYDALESDLKATNAALWEVEDALRMHESASDFGSEFVALARAVYKTNDRRAELKRQINILSNSSVIEEKSYSG